MRVDEITKNLATTGSAFVLVREGGEALVKLRQSKMVADMKSLDNVGALLKRKSLPYIKSHEVSLISSANK